MPSDAAKLVMALAVAVAVGVIMLGPVSTVVADSTGTQNVVNETVTTSATLGETYDLDGYDVVSGSETVYAEDGSAGSFTELTASGNYTLHEANGSITLDSSASNISAGDEVLITYDYTAAGSTATLVIGFIPLGLGLLIFVAIARATTDYL